MTQLLPNIEQHAPILLKWYQEEKLKFSTQTYTSQGTDFQRLFKPYTNWDTSTVLESEIKFNLSALAKLGHLLSNWKAEDRKATLSLLILCLKNRAEYASNQADFYPVYASMVVFSYTLLTLNLTAGWKIVIGTTALIFLTATFKNRVETRRQVSHIKELTNILEAYKSDFAPKGNAA